MTAPPTDPRIVAALRRELPGLHQAVPLAPYCAYGVGGPAELLFEATCTEALRQASVTGRQLGLPVTILGRGTNVLVSDEGLRGLVVLARNTEVDLTGEVVRCGAGAVLAELITDLARRGLGGLEFAANIPGSVGGAVVGNAGAYGCAVGETLLDVEALVNGRVATLLPADLRLGYRTSAFKHGAADPATNDLAAATVLQASFVLTPGLRSALLAKIARDAELRRSKHPLDCASCGSYFKNPSSDRPAAVCIQEAGLKGLQIGGARVSERHANFLVALPGARAADIIALANEVKRRVHDHAGVDLVEEVVPLGFH